MTALQALLLGVLQGLTEFLPVSSSGHLVLGKKVLGVASEMPVTFEVVVHAGTLIATLLVFWRPVWEILVFLASAVRRQAGGRQDSQSGTKAGGPPFGEVRRWWTDPAGRLLTLIVVGTIPAVLVGFLLEEKIELLFGNALLVGMALCVTGAVLFASRWSRCRREGIEGISLGMGVLVGIAQALAITPGISRSGATIATGLLGGIDRETAARFSFLLSMPAVAGAVVVKTGDIAQAGGEVGWLPLLVGFAASLVVGYAALRVLLAFVRYGRLHWFAYYCWPVGGAATVAFALGFLRG
ncbi:hypothetical protein AMJ85_08375 [candidate division BRC1 bacterium SM23_51]|nr:MAG: hypothetical protein AMJ85_08375 [candidate division BRC1 bacterium SM23_51]